MLHINTKSNQNLTFHQRLAKGKKGEMIIDHLLVNFYGYTNINLTEVTNYQDQNINNLLVDVSEIPKYQKMGIDRILYESDDREIWLEIKTDYKCLDTNNLFFEIERGNAPSWALKSKADFFVYVIPNQEILFIEPCKFRQFILQQQEQLQKRMIEQRMGIIIPLAQARTLIQWRIPLQFSLF
jgi:hypothetical protein